ncbi:MAG: hypothetical protein R3B46_09265 [Phycisphaerales bacterium]
MIFFIIYAIGIWVAVYASREVACGGDMMASITPFSWRPSCCCGRRSILDRASLLLANLGGYGRLLAVFTGAFGFMILFVGAVILATPRRVPAGCCIICRYDLTGAPTSICPECGSVESAR